MRMLLLIAVLSVTGCGGGSGQSAGTDGGDRGGCVLPPVPAGISTAAGNGQVTISWDPVSGATSYNIYWATTSGFTKVDGTKITNATAPYTQTGLTNGTTYYYVITAVNECGEGSESQQGSATPSAVQSPPQLPPPPNSGAY